MSLIIILIKVDSLNLNLNKYMLHTKKGGWAAS